MKTPWTLLLSLVFAVALPGAVQAADGTSPASTELQRLFDEDQAERTPEAGKVIDWSAVSLRDEARQQRVKALLANGSLQSGADYFHAAMVMQHASEPDDYLLAHDLCVIAIGKGERQARFLAAASMDRFLRRIGRPQRYGTQYYSNHPSRPPKLAPVDPGVPDAIRLEMNVPTLAQAQAKEQRMASEHAAMQTLRASSPAP